MTEISQDILTELQIIKWLLIVVVLISSYFTFVFFMVLSKLDGGAAALGHRIEHKKMEREIQAMLGKGNALSAKFQAIEWTVSHPKEPLAHWYLAKSLDQLGEFVETKKALVHLQSISPDWNDSIEPWLERIEEELTPKGVD